MMIFSSDFYNNSFPTLLFFVKTILLVCFMQTAIQCGQDAPRSESNSDSQNGQSSGQSPEQPSQNSPEQSFKQFFKPPFAQSFQPPFEQPFQNNFEQTFKAPFEQNFQNSFGQPPQNPFWQPPKNPYWQPPKNPYWQPSQNQFWQPPQNQFWQPPQNPFWQPPGTPFWQAPNFPFKRPSFIPPLGKPFFPMKIYGYSYYNPMTGKPLEGTIDDDERTPWGAPKINFKGLPCACVDFSCGCCAGLNITVIGLDKVFCSNFTFDLPKLTIDMKIMMNEIELFKTNVSGRNPPPVCANMPQIPALDFCLRFYDLALFPDTNNLQTCINFETRVAQSPLLVMHFNCVRVGSDGISWIKPGESIGNISINAPAPAAEAIKPFAEVFDKVNFETAGVAGNDGFPIKGPTLSPEDEEKIGEHRFTG